MKIIWAGICLYSRNQGHIYRKRPENPKTKGKGKSTKTKLHWQAQQQEIWLGKYHSTRILNAKDGNKHQQEDGWAKLGISVKKWISLGSKDVLFLSCEEILVLVAGKVLTKIHVILDYLSEYLYLSLNHPWHISHLDCYGYYA